MTAPGGSGSPKWGPDPQELSLKVIFPTQPTCSNIRYMFAGCLHILLLRCSQHPFCQETVKYGTCTNDSPKTLFNTCPNPKETFSAMEVAGSCPVCAAQAETRLKMINLEAKICHLQQEIKQCRASRGNMHFSSSMRSEILKAELQRANEALRTLERSFDFCGGGPGMDSLGLRASYEPGKFRKVAAPCWWGGCEEDNKLWGWGLDA